MASIATDMTRISMTELTNFIFVELEQVEFLGLVYPRRHMALMTRRRAVMIVNRVRLLAFLFAVLTPLWSVVDLIVFPYPLWSDLVMIRLATSGLFATLLLYRPNGKLLDAYRSMALLFAVPTAFYVASYVLLGHYRLTGISAAVGTGYAFLPFVLLAGLSIFPLTLVEILLFASPMLIAQLSAGILRWGNLDWPSFAGAFWLLILITGVSTLASMSQLAFMIALVRQAIRDPLTGVFSRSSGEEVLALQFSIVARSGAALCIAFIDLDHFKSINDRYGHEAGDKVLCNMTDLVVRHLRRSDLLIRWGGEEFLLIMPDTDLAQAQSTLMRLMKIGFGFLPDHSPITASIGIAERSMDHADDWHALVEIADRRMYHAKKNGRARLCWRDE